MNTSNAVKVLNSFCFNYLKKRLQGRLNSFKIDSRVCHKSVSEKVIDWQKPIADWQRFIKNRICPRDVATIFWRSRSKRNNALAQFGFLKSIMKIPLLWIVHNSICRPQVYFGPQTK